REGLGGWQARVELGVHQETPHLPVGHPTDEVLDVDPSVAQGAALAIRLRDLGLEGDDALEARNEIRHDVLPHARVRVCPSCVPSAPLTPRILPHRTGRGWPV